MFRASILVLALAISTSQAGAILTGAATDESNYCAQHKGLWTLLPPPPQTPGQHQNCSYHQNSIPVTAPCGTCYFPSPTDCFAARGTWIPDASQSPPPFAHCILPDGNVQTSRPGSADPGTDTDPHGGPRTCAQDGLVSDGMGGCLRPDGGAHCEASRENCIDAPERRHLQLPQTGTPPRTLPGHMQLQPGRTLVPAPQPVPADLKAHAAPVPLGTVKPKPSAADCAKLGQTLQGDICVAKPPPRR